MSIIYKEFVRKAGEIDEQKESDFKNMEIQQFMFDIDSALKDGDINHSERDYLFSLV